eukprot:TRINITY_DN46242_c0_g1_i1.p1 TRINITY_DN46242_c0_g1~~TRINITY_DN46242_c0_g1_i1.p1  ORF type:complete len:475 (-),score=75.97 TRINITY_DN46242_c0_g1_i1:122-1546(-)
MFSSEITKKWLEDNCKKTGGYRNPALNDELLLHCKGFTKIQNIEEYTSCKCIWLEQNAISEIEGLDTLLELRTLFLHQNCIREIKNLTHLKHLTTLNLSNNWITEIKNLKGLNELETLQISHNRISRIEGIQEVLELPKLECFDISHNKLDVKEGEQAEDLLDFCEKLPACLCLYMHGNPIIGKIQHYRKKMVLRCTKLTYLDERPVFDTEARLTKAWGRGGYDEEQRERVLIAEEKKAEMKRDMDRWKELQEKGRPLKEQREKEWDQYMEKKQIEDEAIRQARRQQQQEFILEETKARDGLEVEYYRATTALLKVQSSLVAMFKTDQREMMTLNQREWQVRGDLLKDEADAWNEINNLQEQEKLAAQEAEGQRKKRAAEEQEQKKELVALGELPAKDQVLKTIMNEISEVKTQTAEQLTSGEPEPGSEVPSQAAPVAKGPAPTVNQATTKKKEKQLNIWNMYLQWEAKRVSAP